MIIGLTGYARSGKDFISDHIVKDYGFTKYVFSDILSEVLDEMKIENTKDNQSKLGVALRKASGCQNILALLLYKKIKDFDNVIISGFRSPEEVDLFKEHFGNRFKLIHVKRNFKSRFDSRRMYEQSEDDFKRRDERDGKEMGLDNIIQNKMFDIEIENDGTIETLYTTVNDAMAKFNYKK